MGRNQRDTAKREKQEDQRNNYRNNDRQTRNFRERKCRIILSNRAGPVGQRTRLSAAMVTGLVIPTTMKMKCLNRRLLKLVKTSRTDDACHKANGDQETGKQARHLGRMH